jgi:hypothetical protein
MNICIHPVMGTPAYSGLNAYNKYFIGVFYKTRGRWTEETKGYSSLDTALSVAKRRSQRYTITRVRDENGPVAVFDNYCDIEVPECYHNELNRFAGSAGAGLSFQKALGRLMNQ